MQYVITSRQSRQAEQETIHNGTSALTLMENAGVEAYNRIRRDIRKKVRFLILCGTGGNGGDGYVLARYLYDAGYRKVDVLALGQPVHPEAKANSELYKGNRVDKIGKRYDIFIDCLFGTGFTGSLPEKARKLIQTINSLPGKKYSIDMPSGVDATTGLVHGIAFKCHLLLVVQYLKTGLFLNDASKYFDTVKLLDISIDIKAKDVLPRYFEREELKSVPLSQKDYEILAKESLIRFQGVGERGYEYFTQYLETMAKAQKKILVVPGRESWLSDGAKVVIVPGADEKTIRKGITLLSK